MLPFSSLAATRRPPYRLLSILSAAVLGCRLCARSSASPPAGFTQGGGLGKCGPSLPLKKYNTETVLSHPRSQPVATVLFLFLAPRGVVSRYKPPGVCLCAAGPCGVLIYLSYFVYRCCDEKNGAPGAHSLRHERLFYLKSQVPR